MVGFGPWGIWGPGVDAGGGGATPSHDGTLFVSAMQMGLYWCWASTPVTPIPGGGGTTGGGPGGHPAGHFGAWGLWPGHDTRDPNPPKRRKKAEPDLPAPEYLEPPQYIAPEDALRSEQLIELAKSAFAPPSEIVYLTPEQRMQAVLDAQASRARALGAHVTQEQVDDAIVMLLLTW